MLIDLAENKDQRYVSLKDVANRQGISKKYLEQIVAILNQSGILRVNRGYQGGYMLTQPPDKYTVGQILRITEGSLCPVTCLDFLPNQCERRGSCKTLPVWEGLGTVIGEYLDGITLQDIIDGYGSADPGGYDI